MDNQILNNLNKKKFSSPEVLSLVLLRVLKIVLFCLSLTFLFWLFLLKNYLLFTFFLGIVLGSVAEILTNSRKGSLKNKPAEEKVEEQEKKELVTSEWFILSAQIGAQSKTQNYYLTKLFPLIKSLKILLPFSSKVTIII